MLARELTAGSRGIGRSSHITRSLGSNSTLPCLYATERCLSVSWRRWASTFEYQTSMDRLPVPDLNDTAHKYLKSLLPLLDDSDFEHENNVVSKFCDPGGPGPFLQEKLQQRASEELNWLEKYWDNMYLSLRDPIPVNVPYFLQFKDVPRSSMFPGGELQYTAHIVSKFLEFKGLIDREELEPDVDGKGNPMCMNQFARLFNHARIPRKGIDELKCYHAAPAALKYRHFATEHIDDVPNNHILVICNKHMYTVNVADDNGPYKAERIEVSLRGIAEDASRRGPNPHTVQTLTYANRDLWAEARETLFQSSDTNRESLKAIDSALFVVCLDQFEEYGKREAQVPDNTDSVAQNNVAHRLMLGEAGNRWYDKHQLCVFPQLRAGVTMEHAPGDATPVLKMLDWAIDKLHADSDQPFSPDQTIKDFKRLTFDIPESVQQKIEHTTDSVHETEDDVTTQTLSFLQFGSDHIKKQLAFPPDTFVQLAIGLAWQKLYGFSTPQYESVATRGFLHGRTEAMRSTSIESMLFCQSMETPKFMTAEKRRSQMARLKEAAQAHQLLISDCKQGKGIDRHLYGLMNIAKEEQIDPLPELFHSKGFRESSTWRLSTSNAGIPALQRFGYGPVSPDGYGVGYMVHPEKLMFDITAFRKCETRPMDAKEYAAALRESFEEMERMCLDQPS
eukprot:gb/GECG01008282.1/.p1 GENE.gb/GECG01008282.1/~~gb/GECG01008282.1/.p1  ORF type:complete len:676 (+),score=73.15 gb/GECG01008282.1/:1-2028(+)